MRSALRALIWEQTKPILPVMAAGAAACAFFNALPWISWRHPSDSEVSTWFSMGAIVAFFIVLLLTSADPNDLRPRFGARLYRLPVRTFTIITTLFVLRIVLVTVEVVAILALHTYLNSPDDLLLNVPTVAALVATYAILQAIGWSVGNASTKAAVSLGLLLIAIYVGGLMLMERWQTTGYRFQHDARFPPLWFRESLRFVEHNLHRPGGLLACLAGAYAAIYAGVTLDRRGWFQNPRSLRDLADSFSMFRVRPARCFKSPAAAQRWFEWRRMGLLLPSVVLVILAMSVLIPTVLTHASWPTVELHYIKNVFVLQAAALFLGTVLSSMALRVLDRHDQRSGLARFIAVRPLYAWGIARARFEASLLSVLVAMTALAVLSLGWTLTAAPAGKVLSLWLTYPTYSVMRVATYLFFAAFLWGVLLMATMPASVLANKTVALIAILVASILGGSYALHNVAVLLAAVAMTAIVAVAFLLYRPAYRKGLIGADVVWSGIVGWLVLFVLYTAIMMPGSGIFSAMPSDYLIASVLCTIPVAPLAGVPLAVHRWRHNQTGHNGWML